MSVDQTAGPGQSTLTSWADGIQSCCVCDAIVVQPAGTWWWVHIVPADHEAVLEAAVQQVIAEVERDTDPGRSANEVLRRYERAGSTVGSRAVAAMVRRRLGIEREEEF